MTDFEKALQFVRDNCTFGEEEIRCALHKMDLNRAPLYVVAHEISDEINDLMNEYGEEYGFPEGWWLEHGDEQDVFMAL